jgi:hypothetical protein
VRPNLDLPGFFENVAGDHLSLSFFPTSDSPESKPSSEDSGAKSGALPADLGIVVDR